MVLIWRWGKAADVRIFHINRSSPLLLRTKFSELFCDPFSANVWGTIHRESPCVLKSCTLFNLEIIKWRKFIFPLTRQKWIQFQGWFSHLKINLIFFSIRISAYHTSIETKKRRHACVSIQFSIYFSYCRFSILLNYHFSHKFRTILYFNNSKICDIRIQESRQYSVMVNLLRLFNKLFDFFIHCQSHKQKYSIWIYLWNTGRKRDKITFVGTIIS